MKTALALLPALFVAMNLAAADNLPAGYKLIYEQDFANQLDCKNFPALLPA